MATRPAPAYRACARRPAGQAHAGDPRHAARDFARLVEAALALARGASGSATSASGPGAVPRARASRCAQCRREEVGVRERAAVLECVQQAVERKRVGEGGERRGERRRHGAAHAPQTAPPGGGQRAARAGATEARQARVSRRRRPARLPHGAAHSAQAAAARAGRAARQRPASGSRVSACGCQIFWPENLTMPEGSSTLRWQLHRLKCHAQRSPMPTSAERMTRTHERTRHRRRFAAARKASIPPAPRWSVDADRGAVRRCRSTTCSSARRKCIARITPPTPCSCRR